jgi:hypothetical protein
MRGGTAGRRAAGAAALLAAAALAACVGTGGDAADGGSGGPVDIDIDPANMIDDFEDGDDAIIEQGGRAGDWYAFNDATAGGTQTPPEDAFAPVAGGPEGSSWAAQTTGGGFTEWGAGIGCDLNLGGGDEADGGAASEEKGVFDAGSFTGVVFSAKGNTPIWATLMMRSVLAIEEGGSCDTAAGECDNAHGLLISPTDEWRQYALPFAEVAQEEGWGQQVTFDPAELTSVMFQVGPGVEFDVWIDQIGFY